jgi:hypothetical protein
LLNIKQPTEELKSEILKIVRENKPDTLRLLVTLVSKKTGIPESKVFDVIQDLIDEKQLDFVELVFPQSFGEFLFSNRSLWYWVVICLSIMAVISALFIPVSSSPLIYLRNFFGLIFVLYFPGFSLIKTLYPITVPYKTSSQALDLIESIALSIGLSLAVITLMGVVLYNLLAITLYSSTLTLLLLVTPLATIGIIREFYTRKNLFLRKIIVVTGYEVTGDTLRFYYTGNGLVRRRRVLLKKFQLSTITRVDNFGDELSITCNNITNIFLIQANKTELMKLLEHKCRLE